MVRHGQQALHATGQRQLVPTDVRGARRLIALRGVPRQQRVLVVPRRGSGVEGEVAHMGPRADGSGGVIGQGPGPRKEAVRIDQFGGAGEVEAAQALQAREGKITARFRDDLRLPRHVVQEEPPVGRAEPGLPAHQRLQIQGDRLHRPERLQRKLPDPLRPLAGRNRHVGRHLGPADGIEAAVEERAGAGGVPHLFAVHSHRQPHPRRLDRLDADARRQAQVVLEPLVVNVDPLLDRHAGVVGAGGGAAAQGDDQRVALQGGLPFGPGVAPARRAFPWCLAVAETAVVEQAHALLARDARRIGVQGDESAGHSRRQGDHNGDQRGARNPQVHSPLRFVQAQPASPPRG